MELVQEATDRKIMKRIIILLPAGYQCVHLMKEGVLCGSRIERGKERKLVQSSVQRTLMGSILEA
jgi:hypothetical protein